MPLGLVIGNKAYSSWSLRPWLLMGAFHIPFEETVVNIYDEAGKKKLKKLSPTGKVPVLVDGDVQVWESLAIMEYLAEKYPAKNIWPKTKAARAYARSLANEMHAGFMALRQNCPTNFRREPKAIELTPDALANMDAAGRSCLVNFARWTPCSHPSSTACISTKSPYPRPRAPIWTRSWRCPHGAPGTRMRQRRNGASRNTTRCKDAKGPLPFRPRSATRRLWRCIFSN